MSSNNEPKGIVSRMRYRKDDANNLNKQTALAAQFANNVGSLASRLIQARQLRQVIAQFWATTMRFSLLNRPKSSHINDVITP